MAGPDTAPNATGAADAASTAPAPATAGDLAAAHPVEVLTTTRVDDAADFMASLGVGALIVADPIDGSVVGMLTDRDIVVRLVARQLDPLTTEVGAIATPAPATVRADLDIGSALRRMTADGIQRLPVVDDENRPVGILSVDELSTSDQVDRSDLAALLRSCAEAHRSRRRSGAC